MDQEKHYLHVELDEALQKDTVIWEFLRAGSLDGVWYWDLENPENEWMSPEFWQLFGIDPKTKQHKPSEWQDLIFPEDGQIALENFEKHLADPTHPYDQVVRYKHVDGSTVWVRCRGMAIRDGGGKPVRFLGAHVDLTKQLNAEKAISGAERFRELMFANMPDMLFVKDRDFKIVLANDKFLEAYPEDVRDRVIGTTTLEQYDEAERDLFLLEDRRTFSEGISEVEESILFPDGQRRTLLTRKVSFRNDEDEQFLIGIARDITELVVARGEKEKSLALLDTVLKTTSSGIIGLQRDGQIAFINAAARHMLGGTTAPIPMHWPANIQFLDHETVQPLEASKSPIERALAGESIPGQIFLMARAKGTEPRFVRVAASNVTDENSEVKSVFVFEDVSVQERNRQQVERASRLDALGQLTGGIAHDFNNLLATIQYNIQLAQLKIHQSSGAGDADENLDQALKSISRGADLTTRLLSFAKRQPSRATSQNVKDIVEDFKKLSQPVIEASISYDFTPVDEALQVFCDPSQLENALLNLVLNSRDAIMRGGKGSKIAIQVRGISEIDSDHIIRREAPLTYIARGLNPHEEAEDDQSGDVVPRYIEIAVTDDGPGMSDAVKARAIDPFFSTKDTNSGTGLGLSMVYGFVQQSNGELRIYSEQGYGTTVRIILPRGTAEGAREAMQPREQLLKGNGQTILVVEDEPFLLKSMKDLLTVLEYEVIGHSSAQGALERIAAGENIDLLLTDIVMPGELNGFELAAQARKINPDLPIVYMSGYTGYSESEMGEIPAPMVGKPSSPSELSRILKKALS